MYSGRKHFNDDAQLPILGLRTVSPTKEIANLLLKYHDKSRIRIKAPVYVDKNVEFLVDVSRIVHWREFKWTYPVSKEQKRKPCTSIQH